MVDRIDIRTTVPMRHWPIVLLRVYTGVFFAYHGVRKLGHEDFTTALSGFLSGRLEQSFPFYRPFIESVVVPNASVFASLVAWGELLAGAALILGLATRYAAFVAAFMVLNFWFAKGLGFFDGANHDIVWFVILVVLGFIPAGKVVGLDDGLADRLPFLR